MQDLKLKLSLKKARQKRESHVLILTEMPSTKQFTNLLRIRREQLVNKSGHLAQAWTGAEKNYTLNKDVVSTVYSTFKKMAKEGLVYRDNYMVNYCINHGTTLAELEVLHKDQSSPLYFVRYKLAEKGKNDPEYVVVATTRPEPIFVDTHLAVNPDDKKNNWLVGQKACKPPNW